MLEFYVESEEKRRRLCDGAFGPIIQPLAIWLHEQGYASVSGSRWFKFLRRFQRWFLAKGFRNEALHRGHVEQYLKERAATSSGWNKHYASQSGQRSVFPRAFALLEEQQARPGVTQVAAPSTIDEFERHLREQCGLSPIYVARILRHARTFHEFACGQPRAIWRDTPVARVMDFIQDCIKNHICCADAVRSLRKYFTFLRLKGENTSPLLEALPRPRHANRRIPEGILTQDQIRLWLQGFDHTNPEGRRDYAMFLCMADLGMRGSDVTFLRLEDLDWRRGIICIPNHKRGRPYRLPLPQRLGKAIAAYLRDGRPTSNRRELFLRHNTPRHLPLTSGFVRRRIAKVALAQGLPSPLAGSHALRHTAATRMHEHGASLKEVADVLGHSDLNSTRIYAKVNLRELAQAALPWPEGRP